MNKSDYLEIDATRALQESEKVREENHLKLMAAGPYNLLKVMGEPSPYTTAFGYVTLLAAISGQTPEQMELSLGLRAGQLAKGAWIYRLSRVPALDEFLPRGYTTLVDGLHLREDLTQDTAGFRPGHGAYQIVLIKPIEASLAFTLKPGQPFHPGMHPKYR